MNLSLWLLKMQNGSKIVKRVIILSSVLIALMMVSGTMLFLQGTINSVLELIGWVSLIITPSAGIMGLVYGLYMGKFRLAPYKIIDNTHQVVASE